MARAMGESHGEAGQARKSRDWSGTGPPSKRATLKARKAQAASTQEQAVKKWRTSSTKPGQRVQSGGCEAKAMATNLDGEDIVEQGKHGVHEQAWKG
jgi:hypothetical protein